jgi:hypothetical protein
MKNKSFLAFICFIGIFSTPAFSDITLTLNSGEFVQHDNGTVTDNATGLTWQMCAVGQKWDALGACTGKAHVFSYANAIKITSDFADKTDWRLPTLIELNSISELKNNNQPVNKLIFPQMPMDRGFISSTIYAAKTQSLTWIVLTNSGKNSQPTSSSPSTGNYVRLVRGRPSAALASSSPSNTVQPVGQSDLKVTLTVSSNPAKVSQYVNYTLNVTNKGKLTATDTMLSFYLTPNLMRYDSASNNCEKNGDSVICKVGDVNAGESISKTIKVVMQEMGAMSSSTSVKSNEVDANTSDNQAKITVSVKK